jgi:hypothetical protein
MRPGSYLTVAAVFVVVAACGGSSKSTGDADGKAPPPRDSGTTDAPAADVDRGDAPAEAAAKMDAVPDGVARNASCTLLTAETGTAINTAHGRLDGTLVFVLPVGGARACNGDDSHVHLQIEVSGAVYDVAVDIGSTKGGEVGYDEVMMAMPDGAWSEGWHGTDTLAYPSLGLHSTDFTTVAPDTLATQLETRLADVTEISIFCTGYSEEDGCHDVHYEHGDGDDGAIVLNPKAATPSILFFRFTDQTF